MKRRFWTPLDLLAFEAVYPHVRTDRIAAAFEHSLSSCYQMARRLGLSKSAEYLASPEACRLRRDNSGGIPFRFKPGHATWNKGKKLPGWTRGRMAETQFKKGERRGAAVQNWCPVGTIRADSEGYLRIKVREWKRGEHTGFGNTSIWPLLQRHTWEQHHGPIPRGHTVVFRDGNRANCAIENLECISRAELMARNTVHNLPPELKKVIMLNGALKRRLRRLDAQKHADGSAQPPVRDDREAEGQRGSDGDRSGPGDQ